MGMEHPSVKRAGGSAPFHHPTGEVGSVGIEHLSVNRAEGFGIFMSSLVFLSHPKTNILVVRLHIISSM